jgi:hypothetical protein
MTNTALAAAAAAVRAMPDAALNERVRQMQVLLTDPAARRQVAAWARQRGHGDRDVYAGAMQLLPLLVAEQSRRRRKVH